MKVELIPNRRRPGVGLEPRCEAGRPLLPQHARHCPVLEAGSALGFLVYPPLEPHESIQVLHMGEAQYELTYSSYVPADNTWRAIFTVRVAASSRPTTVVEPEFLADTSLTRSEALAVLEAFVRLDELDMPAGGVPLLGSRSFCTPPGWDTLYLPVLNLIDRPLAPALASRVETDWYVHETEFRYVLQPGESLSGVHSIPIGQVLFLPREEPILRDCTDAELDAIRRSQEEFRRKKSESRRATPYGLQYSPAYLRESRARAAERDQGSRPDA